MRLKVAKFDKLINRFFGFFDKIFLKEIIPVYTLSICQKNAIICTFCINHK